MLITKKMKLISNYKHNDSLRGKFNRLALEIFGFDLEDWYQKGFWDSRYVCHSFLEEDQIVSNVSTTAFKVFLNGMVFNAIQIGTVMTKKEFRGKGLGVELTNTVIDQYRSKSDFFYLFAHNKVWDYYKKQGFVPINRFNYFLSIQPEKRSCEPLRKLDLTDPEDFEIMIRLAKRRNPVSKTFGILDDTNVFLFYCLNAYGDHLFYSDSMDCLLIFSASKDKVVHLYDVLCASELGLRDIIPLICFENSDAESVLFHYSPDYPDIIEEPEAILSNDKLFFKGNGTVLPSECL
ncbi:MAG: GNAT family N-acetyltransferase [Desulfobacteraceae bacterium]|nr:GNAT family N-acetyltransferase [Desulfobacteraceae bacterium]